MVLTISPANPSHWPSYTLHRQQAEDLVTQQYQQAQLHYRKGNKISLLTEQTQQTVQQLIIFVCE